MAQPLRNDMDQDTITLDPEGKRRIDQVRVRQLAFRIKSQFSRLTDDDAEAIAAALLEAADEGITPTARDLRARLRRHGHSEPDTERLISGLGHPNS